MEDTANRDTNYKKMSVNQICKLMGYTNIKNFIKNEPILCSGRRPSKKFLIELAKSGHTKEDSFTNSLEEMQDMIKELSEVISEEDLNSDEVKKELGALEELVNPDGSLNLEALNKKD